MSRLYATVQEPAKTLRKNVIIVPTRVVVARRRIDQTPAAQRGLLAGRLGCDGRSAQPPAEVMCCHSLKTGHEFVNGIAYNTMGRADRR